MKFDEINTRNIGNRMRVGLFGGSFNPIHNSHVKVVDEVLREKIVDEVWVIPCYSHNLGKDFVLFKDRVEMIRLAFKDFDNVRVCEIEKEMGGFSKTYDTISELRKRFDYEFFWICGSDCLQDLKKWYRGEDLIREIEFIVYIRKNFDIKVGLGVDVLHILENSPDNISSTEIRAKIKNNKSVSGLLSREVLGYLNKMELYK